MDLENIGKQIGQLRARAGLSLRQLGTKADISAAALSAIETGKNSPTLATLNKILQALETNFAEFITDCEAWGETPVFRAADMRSIEDRHRKYTFVFPPRKGFKFELLRETILPEETEGEWETHKFDLGVLIIEGGPALFEIENAGEWVLEEGDAFYIKAGQKNRLTNKGKRPVKMVSIVSPPKY